MKLYYISKNSQPKEGPFNLDELKKIKIDKDTLVWYEGLEEWKSANEIDELKDLISSRTKKKSSPTKKSLSEEERLFIKYARSNILKVPNSELAKVLEKNNSTVSKAEKIFVKYPIHDVLVPILEGSISDLDLKLFSGQVELGQDIKYFKKYYKKVENSGVTKSKNSEKTELTVYGKSKKINREVQSLVLTFENKKLISFEDKRDNAITGTKKVNKKNFSLVWILNPIEIIEFILTHKIQDQFENNELIKVLLDAKKNHKSKWKSSKLNNIIDVFDSLDVIENVDNKVLFELLVEEVPLKSFIKKLVSLANDSKRDLDFENLINLYVNKIINTISTLASKLKKKVTKSTYYALDGSSILDSYSTNSLVNLKSKLTLYEVEEEGQYYKTQVYSINEYIDLFIKEIDSYKRQLNELNKISVVSIDISNLKNTFNNARNEFDPVKVESTKKAKGFVKQNWGKRAKNIGCWAVIILILIFFMSGARCGATSIEDIFCCLGFC